jgi:hypothetical protein
MTSVQLAILELLKHCQMWGSRNDLAGTGVSALASLQAKALHRLFQTIRALVEAIRWRLLHNSEKEDYGTGFQPSPSVRQIAGASQAAMRSRFQRSVAAEQAIFLRYGGPKARCHNSLGRSPRTASKGPERAESSIHR